MLVYNVGHGRHHPLRFKVAAPQGQLRQEGRKLIDPREQILEVQPFRQGLFIQTDRPERLFLFIVNKAAHLLFDLEHSQAADLVKHREQELHRPDNLNLGHGDDHVIHPVVWT